MKLLLPIAVSVCCVLASFVGWPGTDRTTYLAWTQMASVAAVGPSPGVVAIGWALLAEVLGTVAGRPSTERLALGGVLGAAAGLLAAIDLEVMEVGSQLVVPTPGWGFRLASVAVVVAFVVGWWGAARLADRVGLWGGSVLLVATVPGALFTLATVMFQLVRLGEYSLIGVAVMLFFLSLPVAVGVVVAALRGFRAPVVDGKPLAGMDQAMMLGALCTLPLVLSGARHRLTTPLGLHDFSALWTPAAHLPSLWLVLPALLLASGAGLWVSSGTVSKT